MTAGAATRTPGRSLAFAGLSVFAIGLVAAFLAIPVIALVTEVPPGDVPRLLGDPAIREAMRVTAITNVIANVVILAFGTPAAYFLATRSFRGRGLLITVLELPVVMPPAVAGIALLSAFGAMGLIGEPLARAGIVLPFTQWATVIAIIFVASPFYLRQAIAAFEAVDPALRDAARTLGASPWRVFRRVALPLAMSGLLAGWVLAFARGVGEFGATIIFAGNVRGETQTMTLAIYELLSVDFDLAVALSILLLLLSGTVLVTYKLLSGWKPSTPTSI